MEKVFMFLSFFLGFLSVVMAFVLSWNTNKLVRTEDERAKRMIDEGNRRTQEMIRELGEMTKETQKMIDEGNRRVQEMIEEGNRRTQELIREMDKRHQETMEYLGSLIKADGEKTRELINKVLEKIPG
jgi:F0F1-type ATP synthase membrane subunit b/b'